MGEFLGSLMIISVIGWGTAFTALHFRRHLKRMDGSVDHEVLARILEDVDQISTRRNNDNAIPIKWRYDDPTRRITIT